ncbi:MAG: flagellar hook protein [Lachnospiraceae bacterium]|nr:flagellar hook protein [Lachnospiraceae bacterium]
MVVQHNLTAMNSNRMLGLTTKTQAKSTEKLSSGYKINRAADDAAGLSISEKMRKQIRGLTQASLNAQDGISAVQTAEGALTEVHDMLQRMNELAVKASNGTMSEDDRSYVQNEIDQLVTEIDRVSETTKFNETYLLKGAGDKSATVKADATIGTTSSEATVTAAKGNIYSGTIASGLASGTEDTATVTYKDAEGNTRTKEVTFKAGADAEATAKNLAKAIEDDKDLGRIFNASADKSGKLTVESKLNGNKTDDSKNAVTGITFKSTAGALKTDITGATTEAATGESVTFTLTNKAGANQLQDGNSITIDGKTYTYDSNKASTTDDANTFKSLDDLQKLLGDDYKVSVEITATKTSQKWKADPAVGASAAIKDGDEVVTTEKTDLAAASKTSALDTITAANGTNAFTDVAKPTGNAAGTQVTYTDKVITLNIARKAAVETSDALTLSLQVGADSTDENKISVDIESMGAKSLGIDGLKVDGTNSTNADNAVDTIAAAIQKVSTQRSSLGAVQNRLEHTINNLDNVVENTTSAESQIRDTDMATEMVKYSNNNILAQAGQAMLAQSNQSNQGVLSLLQ